MLLLRIVGLIAAIAIASGIVAWLFTGERKYLGFAARVAKIAVALALLLFVLLAAERLLVVL